MRRPYRGLNPLRKVIPEAKVKNPALAGHCLLRRTYRSRKRSGRFLQIEAGEVMALRYWAGNHHVKDAHGPSHLRPGEGSRLSLSAPSRPTNYAVMGQKGEVDLGTYSVRFP